MDTYPRLDDSNSAIKYGRNSLFGYTAGDNDGFVTQDSFGYVARANYPTQMSLLELI